MRLLLISGHLGSGKTTFIVTLSEIVTAAGHKVAILVNEIGEIGIDNQYMRQLDMNVYELLGGCICCTLSADLPLTLKKLAADHAPELVLMEPSGAADPGNVMAGIEKYLEETLECYRIIALLDPLRLPMFMAVLSPLTTSLIRNAHVIVINKTDLASRQERDEAFRISHEINPEARIFDHSSKQDIQPELISETLSCLK